MADDRTHRPPPFRPERPGGFPPRPSNPRPPAFQQGAPRPWAPRPGAPPPRPPAPMLPPAGETASVRLSDGERECEVHGSPAFCRQVLDDLPTLMARLRGEHAAPPAAVIPFGARPPGDGPRVPDATARAASISLPPETPEVTEAPTNHLPSAPVIATHPGDAEPQATAARSHPQLAVVHRGPTPDERSTERRTTRDRHGAKKLEASETRGRSAGEGGGPDTSALANEVLAVVRRAPRPIGIAEIRERLTEDVTGQQVRRILERDDRVVSVGGRPAAYRVR